MCKRDMRALEIDLESWEYIAADRSSWRCLLHKQLKEGEEKITNEAIKKRTRRKEKTTTDSAASTHICFSCGKDCHSRAHWPHTPQAASFRAKHYQLTMIEHSLTEGGLQYNLCVTQPCLHILMQTRLSANQSARTILVIL